MINKTICLVFMVLLLTLTACTLAADSTLQPSEIHPPTLASDTSKTIFFPRQKTTEGERAVMEGETTGMLVMADNCIRLDNDKSATSYLLIWPPDFNYSIVDDTVIILNDDGKIVASVGDKVYMGGGEIHLLSMIDKSVQEQVPPRCNGPYWIIGEGFTRVDSSK
jgi:hypothetical protein